jgi:hypothetical protein
LMLQLKAFGGRYAEDDQNNGGDYETDSRFHIKS